MKPSSTFGGEDLKPAFFIAVLAMMLVSCPIGLSMPLAAPNLIIILTDAQGYHDVGFNGCEDIPTPNLDSIASNGVRFTSGYAVSPYSSPSRAGLLTGRYPERFGYERNPEWHLNNPGARLPMSETTLADTLGKVGYRTGIIGKWHLGSDSMAHPLRRGFDEFFGFLGAGHQYLPEELTIVSSREAKNEADSWHLWILRNYEPVRVTSYLTDTFSEEAVNFIERNQHGPFFLLLAYNAPQTPLAATDKYLGRFTKILSPKRRTYAAMISAVDDGVGGILKELAKDGLMDKTLVVYLSASAGALESNSSDNYPLRGSRNNLYEGGWRVPFAMQWPGHLPKGEIYDQPILSLDIFATISEIAGAPTDRPRPLDGVNLIPFLTGIKTGAPHPAIYTRSPDRGAFAIRNGDYKLVVSGTGEPAELYNLTSDIGELKNLADTMPEMVKDLEQKFKNWDNQMQISDGIIDQHSLHPLPIDSESGETETNHED